MRKFKSDGKLINIEGIYSMHSQVLDEVREKTPTPVFKTKFSGSGDLKRANMFYSFLKGKDNKDR